MYSNYFLYIPEKKTWLQQYIFETCQQDLQEKFCKAGHDCFGARGQAETDLKIEDLS
jgi:hypothetical protein